jgi:soluble lytic murein transglycosylase
MRSARRLGDDEVTIVKACAASLDAVSGGARQDVGHTLCRIRWLRRHDDVAPTKLMLAAPGGAQQRLVHERRDEVRQNLGRKGVTNALSAQALNFRA